VNQGAVTAKVIGRGCIPESKEERNELIKQKRKEEHEKQMK
jgi:hypothetical protein